MTHSWGLMPDGMARVLPVLTCSSTWLFDRPCLRMRIKHNISNAARAQSADKMCICRQKLEF